jgi:hypothetical protein
MIVTVVPALPEHAVAVGAAARPADRAELWASHRMTPRRAIETGLLVTPDARTALFDGEPACVFGVNPGSLLGGAATPWMVGTGLLERYPLAFLRRSRPVVADWAARYTVLANHVDARNTFAVAWLRWLGFRIDEPVPYGVDQLPFHPFSLEVANV